MTMARDIRDIVQMTVIRKVGAISNVMLDRNARAVDIFCVVR